jgi:hypothetical protein
VLAIIILIIIRFPVSGEEIKVEPVKKRSDHIELKFNDVRFKWKMDQIEIKWKATDLFDVRYNLQSDDIDEYHTMLLFSLQF